MKQETNGQERGREKNRNKGNSSTEKKENLSGKMIRNRKSA